VTTPATATDSTIPIAGTAPVSSAGLLPEWLALREGADGDARAGELVEALREYLPGDGMVVRDLGCGTGSLGRWLAERLAGPQRWILHDREPGLLALAREGMPRASLDGRPVTAVTEERDVTGLGANELAGTSLVCGSALLDLLTAEELDAIAESCVAAGCAVYLTLSVLGRVELTPADPLDAEIADAFNAHQRRTVRGRRLLGPDAVAHTVETFERLGTTVTVADSPWRLGPAEAALTASWLDGWIDAACEQRPELTAEAADYRRRRLAAAAAGELQAVVHHGDLLALPDQSDPRAAAGRGDPAVTAERR
jgi:SAM-dependent methyltransferase